MSDENTNISSGGFDYKKFWLIFTISLSLIMSIASLTLSVITLNSITEHKVVISKQYDRGQSYEKAVKQNKPIIAFFYADWCGYCQRFAPTFKKVVKDRTIRKNFAIAYINCDDEKNNDLKKEFEITGFPTVYVIQSDKKTRLKNNTFFKDNSKDILIDTLKSFIE